MNLKIEFSAKTDCAGKHEVLTDVCAAYIQQIGYVPPTWIFVSYPDKGYWNGKVLIHAHYTNDIRKIYQITKPRNKTERQLAKYLKGELTRRFIEYKPKNKQL